MIRMKQSAMAQLPAGSAREGTSLNRSSLLAHRALASSSLESVGYSVEASTMEIAFRNGSIYRYLGVPLPIYEAFLGADSKGRFFTVAIRTRFPFERLT